MFLSKFLNNVICSCGRIKVCLLNACTLSYFVGSLSDLSRGSLKTKVGIKDIFQIFSAPNGDLFLVCIEDSARRRTPASGDYAVYFFHGNYDVPRKAKDKESLWESEEVYRFLICAVCPVSGDYEPGMPVCGFMFPAFKDRGPDNGRIQVFEADPARPHRDFLNLILPVSAYIL